jgi:hypothetical protein
MPDPYPDLHINIAIQEAAHSLEAAVNTLLPLASTSPLTQSSRIPPPIHIIRHESHLLSDQIK